jgi:ketosteroid isomerase-like protein
MSQENVERSRKAHAAFNQRDREAWLSMCDPGLEVVPAPDWPESDAIRGREAAWEFYVDANAPWESSTFDFVDAIAVGGDKVVTDVRGEIRGTLSGAIAEFSRSQVVTFRDDKMLRHEWFTERSEALAAAGQWRENEEVVRSCYRAWSEGDLDALLALCDVGVELRTSGAFPDMAPVYRGHDGMRAFWHSMRLPWASFRLDVERIVDGEDCAAVAVCFRARGKGSGVATELRQGHAVRLHDGQIFRVSTHMAFDEALEAVGLSE